jgi:hypothetical protein
MDFASLDGQAHIVIGYNARVSFAKPCEGEQFAGLAV